MLASRYRLLKQLGLGACEETYIAEDLFRPDKPKCVIKRLKPMQGTASIRIIQDLFNVEAELLEKLGKHPRIPTLLAHFEENNKFYLVQEFIDGNDLAREIMAVKCFSEIQVVELLTEILEVLFFIHNRRVIHRDIKPSNIIRRKEDKRLFLINFGAVKQIPGKWGEKDIVIGTPGYASSEQLNGQVRLNSDIYALGMTAIHALTGLEPRRILEDSYGEQFRWQYYANVNEKLARVLDKMVCHDYKKRYQLSIEVLDDLRNI